MYSTRHLRRKRLPLVARYGNGRYVSGPITVETFGNFSSSALDLITDRDKTISRDFGEAMKTRFLLQQVSVMAQRFHAVFFARQRRKLMIFLITIVYTISTRLLETRRDTGRGFTTRHRIEAGTRYRTVPV